MDTETTARVGFESIEAINNFVHWFDEFLMSISTLLLGIALMLAIADIGTNGIIFHDNVLLIGWSIATGIGIESQLRTLVRRAKLAYKVDWGAFILWVVLATIIFAVSALALIIFNTEKMLGLTENQALALANINPILYTWGRAILSVILVVISGFAYYQRSVAKPDTASTLAQLQHKREVLPLQMEVDALEAQRKMQNDAHAVKRGVNVVASAATAIQDSRHGKHASLMPASATRIVEADEHGPDDDPTPPSGPRGPRGNSRGRRPSPLIQVPRQIEGMSYARPTGPLGSERVDAAKEIIARSPRELKLREIAAEVNRVVGKGTLSDSNTLKIRNIAYAELAATGRLPKWAEKYVQVAA